MVPIGINLIITQPQPDLDDIVAIFLLKQYGDYYFPGIRSARIEFCYLDDELLRGKTPSDLEGEGVLLVGIGKGRFGKSLVTGTDESDEISTTALVAKEVRCDHKLEVSEIIRYTTNQSLLDEEAPEYDLSELVRRRNLRPSKDPMRVLRWTFEILSDELALQRELHHSARRAIEDDGTVIEHVVDGETIRVIAVQADSTQVRTYAFSSFGKRTALLIQSNSAGIIKIFANSIFKLDLSQVARAIRMEEFYALANALEDNPHSGTKSTIDVPLWYYSQPQQTLLNGNDATSRVIPTVLSLEEVTQIALENLHFLPD